MSAFPVACRFARAKEGAAAVEFALVGPLMIVLMIAIVVYGSWFLMAQSVQALAAEGARAALAGLDAGEQEQLARAEIAASVRKMGGLDPARTSVRMTSDHERLQVVVAYDAKDHPMMALGGMLPLPPVLIERAAAVRTGGYH